MIEHLVLLSTQILENDLMISGKKFVRIKSFVVFTGFQEITTVTVVATGLFC